MSATDVIIDEKIKKEIKEPSKYKVIMLNDDSTPMEWVIELLEIIFKYSRISAEELTLKIHNEGSAVVGIYSYEIAEQKSVEAVTLSRNNGFPLQVKLEEE
jgi:ATP-dependent Clp protease adaptor protein ClpS